MLVRSLIPPKKRTVSRSGCAVRQAHCPERNRREATRPLSVPSGATPDGRYA